MSWKACWFSAPGVRLSGSGGVDKLRQEDQTKLKHNNNAMPDPDPPIETHNPSEPQSPPTQETGFSKGVSEPANPGDVIKPAGTVTSPAAEEPAGASGIGALEPDTAANSAAPASNPGNNPGPAPSTAQSLQSATSDTTPTPAAPVPTNEPAPKRSKTWFLLLLIVLIIAGAAVAAHYVLKSASQQSGTVKKDIPSLSYGLPDGDLTQIYPSTNTATALQLNTQLFEGLVRYDQQTRIVPALATDWSNPDTNTWVFNLRHDVNFHSGRNMTANDVKYSLDYAIDHQNDASLSNLASASTLKKVDVTGKYQVKITTDGPDPILLNRLTFLFVMDSKGKIGDPDSGTGPYVLKPGTKLSENSIDLVAAPHYYGGHVYTRELHIAVVKDSSTLVKDVNNGTFDLAGSLDNYQLAKVTAHYQPIKRQDLGLSFLGINTTRANSPFATPQGRQAAAYALNVPAIMKAGNFRGDPATQIIPPSLPGYDQSIKRAPYDPAKAKQLLAGVKNASAPLTFGYVSDGTPQDQAYFNEIVKELNAAGFNIKATALPDLDTLLSQGFGSGKLDMFSLSDDSATIDGLSIVTDLLEGNQIYHNPQLDDLVQQASNTINPTDRIAVLQKISQLAAKDVPVIPMYIPSDVFTLTKPYYLQVDIPSAYAGVYFWQVYQK